MQSDFGISLFRNLYIDNKTRNPKVKGMNDFQNNVSFTKCAIGYSIDIPVTKQLIRSFTTGEVVVLTSLATVTVRAMPTSSTTILSPGPARAYPHSRGETPISTAVSVLANAMLPSKCSPCYLDVSENYYDSNKDGTLNGSPLCVQTSCYSDMDIQKTQFDYPGPERLMAAPDALTYVLSNVGANFPGRDEIDKGLVAEVQSFGKKGELISAENAGSLDNSKGNVATDTDGDGIPDVYEDAHGLNSRDASDAMKISSSGYANIEVYLNSLVPSS